LYIPLLKLVACINFILDEKEKKSWNGGGEEEIPPYYLLSHTLFSLMKNKLIE